MAKVDETATWARVKRLVYLKKLPRPLLGKPKVTPAMAGAAGACFPPMSTMKSVTLRSLSTRVADHLTILTDVLIIM